MKRVNILSKLKSQVKLIESLITEGDHWPEDYRRKAINRIKLATAGKTPVYSENDIEADVDSMIAKFEPLSHKNSNLGYFLPIIRMFIGYVGNDKTKRKEFLDNKMNMLVKMLGIISQDPSLESKFKDDIKQKWSLEDFEKHATELQDEISKNDDAQLASVGKSDSTDYDVILIESYEELHDKFGGDKTGYKGQSEWCHTNGKSTYDDWTKGGTYQFFVLAKKGWENITPPDPKTTNAFDEYGTSLIAILVRVRDCELLNATLRWNHIIEPGETVPKTSVDKAFLGWGDLSKVVGFNVKVAVEKELKRIRDEFAAKTKTIMSAINDKLKTVTEIDENTFTKDEKQFITQLDIPNNVTNIGEYAFENCKSLMTVTIPDSVTSIGGHAFYKCSGLTGVTIPDSVKWIGDYAFSNDTGLTGVTIGNGVKSIGKGAFYGCDRLTTIAIPDSVISIGAYAFQQCKGFTSVTIGNGVKSIAASAFWKCTGLMNVIIPDGVTNLGDYVFFDCTGLTNVTIPASVTRIGNSAFFGCNKLSSATFEGKTRDQVRSMLDYPWGIKNSKEVIRVTDASN